MAGDHPGVNPHTIKVTVLSKRTAAATGNKVDIDAYLALKWTGGPAGKTSVRRARPTSLPGCRSPFPFS